MLILTSKQPLFIISRNHDELTCSLYRKNHGSSSALSWLVASFFLLLAALALLLGAILIHMDKQSYSLHVGHGRNLKKTFPFDILEGDDDDATPHLRIEISPSKIYNAAASFGCVCAAALAAGLTMGERSLKIE